MNSVFRLGEYTLDSQIGRGGFSDVWVATHPGTRERLAIKAVKPQRRQESAVYTAFLREADAVARLSHLSIVRLYDCGEVSDADAALSGGRLTAGSPYLVMPYFAGGSIADTRRLPLDGVKQVLDDVLQALAHAHARGVLHLDIKPQNILRDTSGVRHRFVVTDFGASALLGRYGLADGAEQLSMGTPLYMAPERLSGDQGDHGPWTDLFSVAVMAWMLATGQAPYPSDDINVLATSIRRWGLPNLPDGFAAPVVFRRWLAQAGHRDPAQRFVSAAEARAALGDEAWGRVDLSESVAMSSALGTGPTETFSATELVALRPQAPVGDDLPATGSHSGWVRVGAGLPTIDDVTSPPSGSALGLGLLGRRAPAFSGRDDDRQALWETFGASQKNGAPNAVVLEGAAGSGKSRLAHWLAETAAEYCGALALHAIHAPLAAPHDGIAAMVARGLNARASDLAGLNRWASRLLSRLGDTNPFDADLLADLVAPVLFPAAAVRPWPIRLDTDDERHEVVIRLLRRIAARRPVVVVIDDIQWGPSSLAFIERLLDPRQVEPFAVTVVATVRSETRADQEGWSERLAKLTRTPGIEHRVVAPLATESIAAIVRSVIPVRPDVADLLAERAAGNPLLALQLVEDLLRSGSLRVMRGGYALVADQMAAQGTLLEVWSRRVEHALSAVAEAQRDDVREAIERAAALGCFVNDSEWTAVCDDLPGETLGAALYAMWSDQLCIFGRQGWSFAHAMLQQAIDAQAVERGRAAAQHARIARWLAANLGPDASVAQIDRYAAHAERAGWRVEAFDRSFEAEEADTRAIAAINRVRVARMGRQLAHMSPDERRLRRLRYELETIRTDFTMRRDSAVSLAMLTQLREAIVGSRDELLLWDADLLEIDLREEHADAGWKAQRAAELHAKAIALGEQGRAVIVASSMAVACEQQGRVEQALELAVGGESPVRGSRLFYARTTLLAVRVRCSFDLGRFEQGLSSLKTLDELARAAGSRDILFIVLTLRCEALVRHGRWEAAMATLDRALDLALTQARDRDILIHVHRCALCARRGAWEGALEALEAAMDPRRAAQSRGKIAYGVAYASVAMAMLGRTEQWDALVPRAMADLVSWGLREPILERCFADAGVAWLAAGDEVRGRAALERALWGLQGHHDEVARRRVEALLDGTLHHADVSPRFLADVSDVLGDCPDWLLL